jgi:hypothetical protein
MGALSLRFPISEMVRWKSSPSNSILQ